MSNNIPGSNTKFTSILNITQAITINIRDRIMNDPINRDMSAAKIVNIQL